MERIECHTIIGSISVMLEVHGQDVMYITTWMNSLMSELFKSSICSLDCFLTSSSMKHTSTCICIYDYICIYIYI